MTLHNSQFFSTLSTLPCEKWELSLAVVLDWNNGPRSGVCSLCRPAVEFVFDAVGEIHNPDGLDLIQFELRALRHGDVKRIQECLYDLGPVRHPVWVPIWRFTSAARRLAAEAVIEDVLLKKSEPLAYVWSADMVGFSRLQASH
jgi:hypothetical protein